VFWYKNAYYAFCCQTKDIQNHVDNNKAGITLFWIQEKDPATNQYWPSAVQQRVLYQSIG